MVLSGARLKSSNNQIKGILGTKLMEERNIKNNEAAPLKDLLEALEGVIGYKTPSIHFQSKFQAERMNVETTLWSKQKNGNGVVKNSTLSKLIELYKLGIYGLDYRVFNAASVDSFLYELQKHGVGTYGPHVDERFRQLILEASKQCPNYNLSIIGETRPNRRGGITFGPLKNGSVKNYPIGTNIHIRCNGEANSHLLVFNERLGHEIHILKPSILSPSTFCPEESYVIPDAHKHQCETFDIRGPVGIYRLYAIWTTADVASIVSNRVDLGLERPTLLEEETITRLYRLLEPQNETLKVALLEFEVG